MNEVLVYCLVKLAKEKSVVRRTDRPDMTIDFDWDEKNQTRPKPKSKIEFPCTTTIHHVDIFFLPTL